MRVRRPTLAAAQIVREDGAHAPIDAAVELEEVRMLGECRRKLNEAGHPVHVITLIDVAQRLVVDELDAIPLSKVESVTQTTRRSSLSGRSSPTISVSILATVGPLGTLAPYLQASQAGFLPEKKRENCSKILGVLSCLASLDKFKFGAFL